MTASAFATHFEPLPVTPDQRIAAQLADAPFRSGEALAGVATVSPFLAHLMADRERLERVLSCGLSDTVSAARVAPDGDLAAVGEALRRARSDVALAVALADLLAGASVESVTGALSRFADDAIRTALASVLTARGVEPERSGLVVLGLGKLGGDELNYSSDVDLIVVFDPDRAAAAGLDATAAVRATRRMATLLQEQTAAGRAMRVDLRLRPDPGATQAAVSVPSMVHYYQSRARAWERQMMIKARQVAGDAVAGRRLMAALATSLWPSAYEFSAVDEAMALREQMATVRGAGAITVPGHNVKLGRGGIRDVEFFVQGLQRVAGGRERSLRGRATVPMLHALAKAGWIDDTAAHELADGYRTLRKVEHRLQMVGDEQTHTLPGADRLGPIAAMMRVDDLDTALRPVRETVHGHYRTLDATIGGTNPWLPVAGRAAERDAVAAKLREAAAGWRAAGYRSLRTDRAAALLDGLAGPLGDAIAHSADPDAALAALDTFFARLSRGVEVLSRFDAHPELLPVLVLILTAAPRVGEALALRPHLLDILVDPAFFGRLPNERTLAADLAETLDAAPDYEAKLDALRVFGQEQALLIDVRVLTGSLSGVAASLAATTLAEVIVCAALRIAEAAFAVRHGRPPGGRITVLAMGSFGSREMTTASDLDMVFLYGCAGEPSDGEKPLTPGHYYTRLAQRLIAALSAPTAKGALYEVDMRLRPDGRAGPLATHIDAFERYHAESAWVWEQMALTRARPVAGDRALCGRAMAAITDALSRPRGRHGLATDVKAMREKIGAGAGLKRMVGGRVDIAFVAQYLALALPVADTGLDPSAILGRAAEAGAIASADAETLTSAHRLYQRLGQLLALATHDDVMPGDAPPALHPLLTRAGDAPDLAFLDADIAERRTAVRALFERLICEPADGGDRLDGSDPVDGDAPVDRDDPADTNGPADP